MAIVWLAVLGATIVVGILIALVYVTAAGKVPDPKVVAIWAIKLWIINLGLELAILYFAEPALTGPYWGGQWLFMPLLLTGALAFFGGSLTQVRLALDSFTERINSGNLGIGDSKASHRSTVHKVSGINAAEARGRPGGLLAPAPRTGSVGGALAAILVVILALPGNGLVTVATTWFNPNTQELASIPHIISEPSSVPLPPTDVNHIVLVSHGVAAYLGQQALSASGQNLGSEYHTNLQEYTLQSVDGHLYWIAPLVYNNVWANLGKWESPGFVVVDAEDPNVPAKLHVGLHMRYLPDALFNQDLLRHVYLSGYTNANLADPTFEVDDAWKPYYTISVMVPSRGFTGDVVKNVLLVDPQSGIVHEYAPDQVPYWVDRVIPASTVIEYLQWWGEYHDAPWFNPSGANQQVPAVTDPNELQLLFDKVGQKDTPVWLVPMTSSSSADDASTGIVLFDTRDNTGRFYSLAGLGITSNVETTFASNPGNIRGYQVSNVQLYDIFGEPTWVATFYEPNQYGEIFQAVGIVDARHLSGSNVIMAPEKNQALAGYAEWLRDNNIASGTTVPSGAEVRVQGKVARISSEVESGTTVYTMLLTGQNHIFDAGLAVSPELPLVQPGDTVVGTYLETGQTVVTFSQFTDLSLPLSTATPPSATTATPGTS
ncbi:MAG: hypothetical protein ACLQUY_02765 [Ktedonobacterales bacterium]